MKNIIKFSVVLLTMFLVSSCMKDMGISQERSGDRMSLRLFTQKGTKAPVTGVVFPTSRDIMLAANYYGLVDEFMAFHEPFSYSETHEGWVSANEIYWPVKGYYKLLGLSMEDFNNAENYELTENSRLWDYLTFDYDIESQDDILIGYSAKATAHNNTLTFRHALSQVKFSGISTTGYDAEKNVGISVLGLGVRTGVYGTMHFGYLGEDVNGQAVVTSDWSDVDVDNYEIYNGFACETPECINLNDETYSNIGPATLVIPSEMSFTVVYTVHAGKDAEGNALDFIEGETYEYDGVMESGKCYNFKLDFALGRMVVNCVLEDFEDADQTVDIPFFYQPSAIDLGITQTAEPCYYDNGLTDTHTSRFANFDLGGDPSDFGEDFSLSELNSILDLSYYVEFDGAIRPSTWDLSAYQGWSSDAWSLPLLSDFALMMDLNSPWIESIEIDDGYLVITGTNGKKLKLEYKYIGTHEFTLTKASIGDNQYNYYTLPYWNLDIVEALKHPDDTPSYYDDPSDYLLIDLMPILVFKGDEFVEMTTRRQIIAKAESYHAHPSENSYIESYEGEFNMEDGDLFPILWMTPVGEVSVDDLELLIRPVYNEEWMDLVRAGGYYVEPER